MCKPVKVTAGALVVDIVFGLLLSRVGLGVVALSASIVGVYQIVVSNLLLAWIAMAAFAVASIGFIVTLARFQTRLTTRTTVKTKALQMTTQPALERVPVKVLDYRPLHALPAADFSTEKETVDER